jgi:hypothetical protein
MNTTATRLCTRRQRPVRRTGRAVTVLRVITVLAAVGVLATACSHSSSGPGVASGPSSPSENGSSSGSPASAGPLALARCMRAHGVHDFPDPDSSGNFDLSGGGDLNPDYPAYQAAAQACGSSGGGKVTSHLSPQQIAATVQFAQCMRNHGITSYPDPDSSGNIPGIRHYGIDSNSSQFQAAENACKHYMRGIPGWS